MSELHQEFFAPASTDMIAGMVAEYRARRAVIQQVAELMAKPNVVAACNFFIDGDRDHRGVQNNNSSISRLFQSANGIKALNSHYWNSALRQTDVLEIMPQKRKDDWFKMIHDQTAPDFEEQVVRDTIEDLLASRYKFFAERVDNVFRSLSGDHVTNQPQGFYKRMIMANVFDDWGSLAYKKSGIIHDLRAAVARLEYRDEPGSKSTDTILRVARRQTGEWFVFDGGRFKIKAFKVGTCHIEVHPDIAVMLNIVLASLYPLAIPASFRTKQPKPPKNWTVIQRPLPSNVLQALNSCEQAFKFVGTGYNRDRRMIHNSAYFSGYHNEDKQFREEAGRILESIGGVQVTEGAYSYYQFDYNPLPAIHDIVGTGCVPDKKSHQFYPTPKNLAEIAVRLADIQPGMSVLEPSAGVGGLADLVPDNKSVLCVELSELHCNVLRAKGYNVMCRDFLTIEPTDDSLKFSRIIMNPPFSDGRWQAHIEHASKFLLPDGVLTAILPSSAKTRDVLPGFDREWHGVYQNMFPDASVDVVILVAKRISN